MKQLVFIHGGETFSSYEKYLDALRSWDYEPENAVQKKWKDTLIPELGNEWQIFMPSMPSKYNAKYIEWRIWFEKVLPHLTDGTVLVGHSLGGIFLAKFLSENSMPNAIAGTFLVAAPFDEESESGSLADFILPASLDSFEKQGGAIFLYHSEDDPVVPFSELAKYAKQLPEATVRTFSDRGHFLQPEFPELIDDIRALD